MSKPNHFSARESATRYNIQAEVTSSKQETGQLSSKDRFVSRLANYSSYSSLSFLRSRKAAIVNAEQEEPLNPAFMNKEMSSITEYGTPADFPRDWPREPMRIRNKGWSRRWEITFYVLLACMAVSILGNIFLSLAVKQQTSSFLLISPVFSFTSAYVNGIFPHTNVRYNPGGRVLSWQNAPSNEVSISQLSQMGR
jgi:hypothetical protein